VFVTERIARMQLPAADLDEHGHARLSYQQAEVLFAKASGGATPHQLRHFVPALTHDAERGTGPPMLMANSGHTSVRSLGKHAKVSAEALARHQAERDPARRR
jgi:integrase